MTHHKAGIGIFLQSLVLCCLSEIGEKSIVRPSLAKLRVCFKVKMISHDFKTVRALAFIMEKWNKSCHTQRVRSNTNSTKTYQSSKSVK